MDRRVFTKATTASLIAFVAGCTSLDSDSDDQDENDSIDEDSPADDEPADETDDEEAADSGSDDSAGPDEEDDDETDDDANETDPDDAETDTDEVDDEDVSDDEDEPDNADQGEDDGEDDDAGQEEDDDEADEQGENGGDEDDDPPPENEMEATIELDAELEGMLEVVHHEFVWESYQGSHLCNIRVELRNATSDTEILFEGIGSVTDADGTNLGGDIARFGLQPQETTAHVFSMDGCADAASYRLEFEAFDE